MDYGFTKEELIVMRPHDTPAKIQDFLNTIPINFQEGKATCLSPRRVLRENKAQCVEGAFLAAAMLRLAGWRPLVMDLTSADDDYDHVVAVFQIDKCWGAISKTNHGVLRYREPIYRSIRELAMSYFHEYFKDDGRKTLRSHSGAVDLSRFDKQHWMTAEHDLWDLYYHVDDVRHYPFLTRAQQRRLRRADPIEIAMGKLTEWTPKSARRKPHRKPPQKTMTGFGQ